MTSTFTVQNLIDQLHLYNPELPVYYFAHDEHGEPIFIPVSRFLEVTELTDLNENTEFDVYTFSEAIEGDKAIELTFYKLEPDLDGDSVTSISELLASLNAVSDKSIPVLIYEYYDEELSEYTYTTLSSIDVEWYSDLYEEYSLIRCQKDRVITEFSPINPLISLF